MEDPTPEEAARRSGIPLDVMQDFYGYCHDQFTKSVVRPESQRFPCPCCGLPDTLCGRGQYDICGNCGWEDDGQDDPYADEVWWGPNHGLSLTAARKMVQTNGDIFEVGDPRHPWRTIHERSQQEVI